MKKIYFISAILFASAVLFTSCKKESQDTVFSAPTLDCSLNETQLTDYMEKEGYELTEQEQEDPLATYYYAPVKTELGECTWTYSFDNGQMKTIEGEINMEGQSMEAVKNYFDQHYDLKDVVLSYSEDGYDAVYMGPDSVEVELELGTSAAYLTFFVSGVEDYSDVPEAD